ncbi:MAG: alpha/beta hydrolase [Bacteroidetes bacterium]|nr:MAG: alpha/beta hydrolase [Bacteroidota bacterium]
MYGKRRFGLLLLGLLIFGCSRLEILTFRQNERKQSKTFEEAKLHDFHFYTYTFDGRPIHYTHVGADSLPLVLFVHGSPGSSGMFMDYLKDPRLTAVAQMAAPDRPGFGYSGFGKAEPSLEKQAKALAEIIRRHPHRKAILVGHSFGGPVIVRMAAEFPELVDGLIIVAGSVSPELEPREWWRKPADFFLIRWLIPPALRVCNQEILPLYKELKKMLPLWERVRCPVTIFQGESDKLVPKENANFAQKMLQNSPDVRVKIIPQGNHFILWSKADIITEEILRQILAPEVVKMPPHRHS